MQELTLDAAVQNIDVVTDFISARLEELSCPMKARMQIDVAVDELFGNIAHYAYGGEGGQVTVRFEALRDPAAALITFIDAGMPYDPLARDDPDVGLSAAERELGGLGIFLVKKTMDEMDYAYVDGKNVLTIKKLL